MHAQAYRRYIWLRTKVHKITASCAFTSHADFSILLLAPHGRAYRAQVAITLKERPQPMRLVQIRGLAKRPAVLVASRLYRSVFQEVTRGTYGGPVGRTTGGIGLLLHDG